MVSYKYSIEVFYKNNYFSRSFNLSLINHKQIKEGITIIAVITKNTAQGFSKLGIEIDPRLINLYFKLMIAPFSKESTRAPEDEAIIVLPAVPIEASRAY